jgi:mannose-6-phosphate isomerase
MLYPLKFKPILKERIWGGTRLKDEFAKENPEGIVNCGESWELSSVDDNLSVVSNGFLEGNSINELVEIYMADLVGEKVFEKFGIEFPILIKLIDTADFLSVQVHPDDSMAKRLHHAYGKTEMWYVLQCNEDSSIITGFNQQLSREKYLEIMDKGGLKDFLKYESVKSDDFFYIPSRQLHSLGKGILLVEIQQTSDITYRVYDWDRSDSEGKSRELHTDLASDAIDFNAEPIKKQNVPFVVNKVQKLTSEEYFSVNRLVIDKYTERDFFELDTFRIYICIEGEVEIDCDGASPVHISKGELALVPAIISNAALRPKNLAKLLEVFVS